jgi:NADH-quinone oxidoreductase subunit N
VNDLSVLWLPIAVAVLAVGALLADVLSPPPSASRRPRRSPVGIIALLGLVTILIGSFLVEASGTAAYGAYEANAWTLFLQRLFLVAGVLGVLGALDDVWSKTPRRQGEYWLTLLFSLVGMVVLPGARDLILLVVAFELMGMPLYVLAAYAKTDAPADQKTRASEAALKLYLVGATSTAITLFGLALLTGMAGTTRLAELGAAPMTPLAAVGLVFVLAGVGYKIGMVPFHMWVPDTYQGARAPFVAFLSVAPKAAGIAALAQIFLFGLAAHRAQWLPALGMLAFLSMAVGNLLALPQTDLRRLLGYSGIAQMGYVLVGVAANDVFGVAMVLFFLASYLFTNLGAFLVVHAAAEAGGGFGFEGLGGLAKRSPALAATLLCFVLSLAGIPFVVGFWAKLYVLLAAWHAGLFALVIAAIVLAVLGLFYYLRILRAAYMTDGGALPAPKMGRPLGAAIAVCLVAVIGLGVWPTPLIDSTTQAAQALLPRQARAHAR